MRQRSMVMAGARRGRRGEPLSEEDAEQPFGQSTRTRCGADEQEDPHDELSGHDQHGVEAPQGSDQHAHDGDEAEEPGGPTDDGGAEGGGPSAAGQPRIASELSRRSSAYSTAGRQRASAPRSQPAAGEARRVRREEQAQRDDHRQTEHEAPSCPEDAPPEFVRCPPAGQSSPSSSTAGGTAIT